MSENLTILRQWQEIDRNGYLASHVGSAQNIFGVRTAPIRNNNGGRDNNHHNNQFNGRGGGSNGRGGVGNERE